MIAGLMHVDVTLILAFLDYLSLPVVIKLMSWKGSRAWITNIVTLRAVEYTIYIFQAGWKLRLMVKLYSNKALYRLIYVDHLP
jgi:hypothetical protein